MATNSTDTNNTIDMNNPIYKGTTAFANLFLLSKMLNEPGKEMVPGSKFFEFCKQVTKSPATNMFWMRREKFTFMFTVDGFLCPNGEMEPGCHIAYGHNDYDRGSFPVISTVGMFKFDPKKTAELATKGTLKLHEDDIEAFQECVFGLTDLQTKFDLKNN